MQNCHTSQYGSFVAKWIMEYFCDRVEAAMNSREIAFQFKITLCGSSPKVWRRIVVPKTYSFFDLYTAIQDAMGWADSHLHGFYIAQKGTARPIVIQMPDPEGDNAYGGHETRDERNEKIADYFGVLVKQCQYTYDFGDGWDHTVLFEREIPAASHEEYPQCVAGENACPPEDSGGVGGYRELQAIMKNKKHPEHAHMLEWLGLDDASEFDPTRFERDEVHFRDPVEWLKEYMDQLEM